MKPVSPGRSAATSGRSFNRAGIPPMKKVLLVIGDAAELFDTMYPLYRIREDHFQVVVAGPERRVYHLVQHDRHPDWDITVESAGYKLPADIAFRDIKPDEYAGIVLSGGRAPEYIRYDADLLRVVRHMHEKGRPIASVCHGIEILASAADKDAEVAELTRLLGETIDMSDFQNSMTIKEVLALFYEKVAAQTRGKELPIFINQEAFLKVDADKIVYETQINFPSYPKK